MKTRSRKSTAAASCKVDFEIEAAPPKALSASVETPPHVFVLPKNLSPQARIVLLHNQGSESSNRYLVCPEQGFYEFTRIAAPKRASRSWLLTPDRSYATRHSGLKHNGGPESLQEVVAAGNGTTEDASKPNGYIMRSPGMLVATPIDPLFVILPALIGGDSNADQEFLASSDYLTALNEASPHLRSLIHPHAPGNLERTIAERLEAVCDYMDLGEEKVYALSLPKLVREILSKAQRVVSGGLPASLEERFVKQVLDTPNLGVKREDSEISLAGTDVAMGSDGEKASQQDSQSSISTVSSATTSSSSVSYSTAAISVSVGLTDETPSIPVAVLHLLRIRTIFDFMVSSYVPPKLHGKLNALLRDPKASGLEFASLDEHLAHIESLKRRAQALRSLSDNVSRKRSTIDDEETLEKADAKRRKKEEEENKKRSMSQGVKQLMKADTTGMKKLSSFFAKTPAKK